MQQGDQNRLGYLVAPALVALAWVLTRPIYREVDFVFGSMAMLLIVLYVSIRFGIGPAIFASLLSGAYLNYFFVEPFLAINFGSGPDTLALGAFIITAVVVGRLSQRAAQRAREAERGREEIERLYGELKLAFDKTSQLEAIKRSEQMKSALLDAVTHDLRTPLTSIKAAATTLYNSMVGTASTAPLTADLRKELIEVVVQESDRLNHFVEELLVLARIQGGGVDVSEPPGAVEEVTAAATQRASAALHDYQVAIRISDHAHEIQVAHPRISAQVLYALLDNAAKYSPPGTAITISADANESSAVFSIEDQGTGIPAADRELIFSRFYRRPQSASAASPGLGMGLAIARGLVEAVGGSIAVVDKAGPGACFEFSVPLFHGAVQHEPDQNV